MFLLAVPVVLLAIGLMQHGNGHDSDQHTVPGPDQGRDHDREQYRRQQELMGELLDAQDEARSRWDRLCWLLRRALGFLKTVGLWLLAQSRYLPMLEEWAQRWVPGSWLHKAVRVLRRIGEAVRGLFAIFGMGDPAASPA